jgi:hypothetical protein
LDDVNDHRSAIGHEIATGHDINGKQSEKDPLLDQMPLEVSSPQTEVIERQQCHIATIQTDVGEELHSVRRHEEMPRRLSTTTTSDPDVSSEKRSQLEEEDHPKRKGLHTQKSKNSGKIAKSFGPTRKGMLRHAYPSHDPDDEWAVNCPVDVHLEEGIAEVTVQWEVTKVLLNECVGEELLNQIDVMGTRKYGEDWRKHSMHRTMCREPLGVKAKYLRRKAGGKVSRTTVRQFYKGG